MNAQEVEKSALIEVAKRVKPTHLVNFEDAPNVDVYLLDLPNKVKHFEEARRFMADIHLACLEIERVRSERVTSNNTHCAE